MSLLARAGCRVGRLSGPLEAASDGCEVRSRAALGVFLSRSRLELEADEPLVADDPRIVARLDDVRLAGADLDLGSVVVLDAQPAGMDHADVACLAAVRSGDGLDALRPPPPRLEREPPGGRRAHAHDVDLRLVRRARLVGGIEVAPLNTGHGRLLSSVGGIVSSPGSPCNARRRQA